MSLAVAAMGWFFLALSLAGVAYIVGAGVLVARYRDRLATVTGRAPSIALLKPLHGDEPALQANLSSFLAQTYPGRSHMFLGVADPADPAAQVARTCEAAHPQSVTCVVDGRQHGFNRKISNVLNLSDGADADILVLSDSDIRVGPDYLGGLASTLAEPGVGVASCLYFGRAAVPGIWARLAAMGVSYAFLPQVAVGVATGARPCMGSTIALSSQTLAAIGGFARVKDALADDYEIGRAVHELGLKVVAPPFLVSHDSAETSLAAVWRHEVRWAATVRGIDPLGYAGSLVTHVLPLSLVAVVLSAGSPPSLAVLGLALLARLWLKSRVDAVAKATTGPWWLIPARDILSIAVFAGAWSTRRVDWRGTRFHIGRDGALTPV